MDFKNISELPKDYEINSFNHDEFLKTYNLIKKNDVNTVCESANCPNRYECFSKRTATFLILGNKCSRNCKYCNIESFDMNSENNLEVSVDTKEPKRISKTVSDMDLDYVVITSVTRDDLDDYGVNQFIKTIESIKKNEKIKNCSIEVLIPDFKGKLNLIKKLVDSNPNVINHNIEVVRGLFDNLRPHGNYDVSLKVLKFLNEFDIVTKSGLMVGFGESYEDIKKTLNDLYDVGVDIVTVGQYLSPSENHFPVKKYYSKAEFKKIKNYGESLGFSSIVANPFVRSSYKAIEVFNERYNKR
ncbi:MAG: lipoyl synthase [Candidatus Woesearchaeota archaeon]